MSTISDGLTKTLKFGLKSRMIVRDYRNRGSCLFHTERAENLDQRTDTVGRAADQQQKEANFRIEPEDEKKPEIKR